MTICLNIRLVKSMLATSTSLDSLSASSESIKLAWSVWGRSRLVTYILFVQSEKILSIKPVKYN
jgi:hypothetical protein